MKKVLFLICSLLIYSVSIAQHIVKGKVTGADNEVNSISYKNIFTFNNF